jgi:hypothetical protein
MKTDDSETRTTSSVKSPDMQETIRRRAYEIYELRGRVNGFALDDWIQAEEDLQDSDEIANAA